MTTALPLFPHPHEWAAEVHFLLRMSKRYGFGVWPRARTHLDDWRYSCVMKGLCGLKCQAPMQLGMGQGKSLAAEGWQ